MGCMMSADEILPPIRFCWAGSTSVPAGSTYGPYTTDRWEFIWCLEGSAEVESGDDRFTFTVGSAQLTPPGVCNSYRWTKEARSSYGYAIFTLDADPGWVRFRPGLAGDIVPHLLDHVLWLDSVRPAGWDAASTAALGYAIVAFATGHSATQLDRDLEMPDALIRSLAALRDRWDDASDTPLALDDLARAAGVSREHLSRLYQRYTGMGPMAAIRTLRLARASELLSHTNLGVAEIARAVGFANEFHFSRAFRALAGQSPSSFRRDPDARVDLSVALRRLNTQLPPI